MYCYTCYNSPTLLTLLTLLLSIFVYIHILRICLYTHKESIYQYISIYTKVYISIYFYIPKKVELTTCLKALRKE